MFETLFNKTTNDRDTKGIFGKIGDQYKSLSIQCTMYSIEPGLFAFKWWDHNLKTYFEAYCLGIYAEDNVFLGTL